MIASLIPGLSILLLTGITNNYISSWLFVETPKQDDKKHS